MIPVPDLGAGRRCRQPADRRRVHRHSEPVHPGKAPRHRDPDQVTARRHPADRPGVRTSQLAPLASARRPEPPAGHPLPRAARRPSRHLAGSNNVRGLRRHTHHRPRAGRDSHRTHPVRLLPRPGDPHLLPGPGLRSQDRALKESSHHRVPTQGRQQRLPHVRPPPRRRATPRPATPGNGHRHRTLPGTNPANQPETAGACGATPAGAAPHIRRRLVPATLVEVASDISAGSGAGSAHRAGQVARAASGAARRPEVARAPPAVAAPRRRASTWSRRADHPAVPASADRRSAR